MARIIKYNHSIILPHKYLGLSKPSSCYGWFAGQPWVMNPGFVALKKWYVIHTFVHFVQCRTPSLTSLASHPKKSSTGTNSLIPNGFPPPPVLASHNMPQTQNPAGPREASFHRSTTSPLGRMTWRIGTRSSLQTRSAGFQPKDGFHFLQHLDDAAQVQTPVRWTQILLVLWRFPQMGVPQELDGLFHDGWFGGTPILGNHHIPLCFIESQFWLVKSLSIQSVWSKFLHKNTAFTTAGRTSAEDLSKSLYSSTSHWISWSSLSP